MVLVKSVTEMVHEVIDKWSEDDKAEYGDVLLMLTVVVFV